MTHFPLCPATLKSVIKGGGDGTRFFKPRDGWQIRFKMLLLMSGSQLNKIQPLKRNNSF